MKLESKMNLNSSRAGERGAALVTMLLVSVLLLGAGGALIMTTMMSANNSIGSTAEMQAYYVAESGMQSALNVLRGNAKPLDHGNRPHEFSHCHHSRASRMVQATQALYVLPVGFPTTILRIRQASCRSQWEQSPVVTESRSRTWIPTVTSLSFRLQAIIDGSDAGNVVSKNVRHRWRSG